MSAKSKKDKNYEYDYALKWVKNQLKIKNKVRVVIFEEKLHKNYALCFAVNGGYDIMIDDRCTRKEYLSSLFHELVHVKQMSTGDLVETIEDEIKYWKGKKIDNDKIAYSDLPWEIEANYYEKNLYEAYEEHIKLHHLDFSNRVNFSKKRV